MKGLLVGVLVLIAAGVVVYLTLGKASQSANQTPSPTPQQVSQPATSSAEQGKTITVTGAEYSFSPASITLTAGEPTTIVFKNSGKLPHDLVISELGVKTNVISGGKEESVKVTANKTGTYTFYCSVGNHRQLGMEGTATVK